MACRRWVYNLVISFHDSLFLFLFMHDTLDVDVMLFLY